MALEAHPVPAGSNDSENKAIIVRDDRKSPSVELSLRIGLSSSPPLITSQSMVSCRVSDVEAGRCRRTDGRKWRCRREVIPDHKYCERHIHRGRQHSTNSDFKLIKIKKGCRENVETRGHDSRVPLEFSFSSPKSVLRQDIVEGSGTTSKDHSPQRCRRTDGKKWQCSRDVIPTQKYCVQHMHRGAKKVKIAENGQKSNTRLSISAGTSFKKRIGNDEAEGGSSSSEATTVSM